MDVPCTPITPPWKKKKVTNRNFNEMSFEKLTSYHKTFHLKSTSFHMKINNLKHCNIFSYEKKNRYAGIQWNVIFCKVKTVLLNTNHFIWKSTSFHMKINNLKNTSKKDIPSTPITLPIISKMKFYMKWHSPVFHQEIVYPRDIFSYEKGKRWQAGQLC